VFVVAPDARIVFAFADVDPAQWPEPEELVRSLYALRDAQVLLKRQDSAFQYSAVGRLRWRRLRHHWSPRRIDWRCAAAPGQNSIFGRYGTRKFNWLP
jgi:hypothetical protein